MTPRRRTRTAALRTRMMNVAIFGLVSRSAPNWSGIGLGIAEPISWRTGRPAYGRTRIRPRHRNCSRNVEGGRAGEGSARSERGISLLYPPNESTVLDRARVGGGCWWPGPLARLVVTRPLEVQATSTHHPPWRG